MDKTAIGVVRKVLLKAKDGSNEARRFDGLSDYHLTVGGKMSPLAVLRFGQGPWSPTDWGRYPWGRGGTLVRTLPLGRVQASGPFPSMSPCIQS